MTQWVQIMARFLGIWTLYKVSLRERILENQMRYFRVEYLWLKVLLRWKIFVSEIIESLAHGKRLENG